MKLRSSILGLALLAVTLPLHADEAASNPLGNFASLVGEWEAEAPEGKTTASYELLAGGSALLERLNIGEMPTMLTVYHRDGEGLMLTHYCSAANQPRMRSTDSPKSDEVQFSFVDVTNLESADAGHMRDVKFTFVDNDHFVAAWTGGGAGESRSVPLRFTRVN